eukprot:CAMPEP_0184662652 /NCGR_PEP_ID=MMETSP0308-20130426/44279_1 /TAXON_ID=38269 /ORGANISM="Gloeochaete witrockiana, Strain SAG 46.84" /LENGTH=447 /DNA_ID=CAMNT_0027104825 /DNA_START=401 /DNA_END=1741 /DNA_ORIENTATION=+
MKEVTGVFVTSHVAKSHGIGIIPIEHESRLLPPWRSEFIESLSSSEDATTFLSQLVDKGQIDLCLKTVVFTGRDFDLRQPQPPTAASVSQTEPDDIMIAVEAGIRSVGGVASQCGLIPSPFLRQMVRAANFGDIPHDFELLSKLASAYIGAVTVAGGVDYLPSPVVIECSNTAGLRVLDILQRMLQDFLPIRFLPIDDQALQESSVPALPSFAIGIASLFKPQNTYTRAPASPPTVRDKVATITSDCIGVNYSCEDGQDRSWEVTTISGYAIAALISAEIADMLQAAGLSDIADVQCVLVGPREQLRDGEAHFEKRQTELLLKGRASVKLLERPSSEGEVEGPLEAFSCVMSAAATSGVGQSSSQPVVHVVYDLQGRGFVCFSESFKECLRETEREIAADRKAHEATKRMGLERLVQLSDLTVDSPECANAVHTILLTEALLAMKSW